MKKIGSLFSGAGNAAKDALDKAKEKALLVVDRNDDGKFDMKDVSDMADTVGEAIKKGAAVMKENAEEKRREKERNTLQPVFPDMLEQPGFILSKFICVTDRDKRYAESDVCQGSIGFLSNKGGLRVVNLFKDSLDALGLSFYPDRDCSFYYADPTDRARYISLDEYFSFLKMVRVNELQRVAQDLGAKHFKVTYKEEHASLTGVKGKVQVNQIEAERDVSGKRDDVIDVAAEMSMDGHAPVMPKLVYLLNDDNVQNLIHLRMSGGEGFRHHKISIKMSHSSGIKESEAVKIDAVIKGMKVSGIIKVAREARNESHRYLEYEIDF